MNRTKSASDDAIPTYYVVRIPYRCVSEHGIDKRSLIVETALNVLDEDSLVQIGRRFGRGRSEQPVKCVSIRLTPFAASRMGHIKSIDSHFSVSALVTNLLTP